MPFTDQEYFEVIEKNEIVKKAFENIKEKKTRHIGSLCYFFKLHLCRLYRL